MYRTSWDVSERGKELVRTRTFTRLHTPRSREEAIVATAESLLRLGLLRT